MGKKSDDPDALATGGHVALWHPWKDKPGQRHVPVFWENGAFCTENGVLFQPQSAEEAIYYCSQQQLYCLCNDILDSREFSYSKEMVEHEKAQPYITKRGKVIALRCHPTRTSGFFLPASTWSGSGVSRIELVEALRIVFRRFGYEAITPSSLSERVLRSTLPEELFIRRPSNELRYDLLRESGGGRIDKAEIGQYYAVAYTYDLNKAYLSFSREVPSPFERPFRHFQPAIERIWEYPTGFWQCNMVAHGTGIQPIYIGHGTNLHAPIEGESFTKFLWRGEIEDCLEAGYTLDSVERGYGFPEMSDFMSSWVDILWAAMQIDEGELVSAIKKGMAVGLPGRFIKRPETYTLIPSGQAKTGDVPITHNWLDGSGPFFTDWYVRTEFDLEATALTPIGAYIIQQCRREIYHAQIEAAQRGLSPLRSYIDSITLAGRADGFLRVGMGLGEWKEKRMEETYVEENRIIGRPEGDDVVEVAAPGISDRVPLLKKYRKIVAEHI